MSALFGPAGNSKSFANNNYKTKDLGKYLDSYSLTAYEYQCGQGVKVTEKSAAEVRSALNSYNIMLSLHAPYFISLSSVEEEKRLNSVNYIMQSAIAAKLIGATRIIVHSGSCAKITREVALEYAKQTLKLSKDELNRNDLSDIIICPETMGKINQLGTLDEVLELCLVDDTFVPCIDFGHLNARTHGLIKSGEDYLEILNKVENILGYDRLKLFHSHFSKIEYTAGGEKKHLTFADTTYGPDFEPLLELVYKKNLTPTFICESDGTQAEDAKAMMEYYRNLHCN